MKLLFFMLLVSSCAKLSYVAQQGIGQLSLEYNDIDNEDFLNDPKMTPEHKRKLKIIIQAKKYFYDYFSKTQTAIYDEVKMLESQAVSYLVIHAPKDKVQAVSTSFPIVGAFPYLGFFSKKSALEYKLKKENEGYHTFMRNVYAYSTLNHPLLPMHDNVLSSFFYFSDAQLVELIFHELTHTIIFVKDNVSFNENLAQFVSQKMMENYPHIKRNSDEYEKQVEKNKKVRIFISNQIKNLKEEYKKNSGHEQEVLKRFLTEQFHVKGKEFCAQWKMKKCLFIEPSWNNARFAAFGTYEEKRDILGELYLRSGKSLKEFIYLLEKILEDVDSKSNLMELIERKI